jgi:antimicrobial peptide system SdpB family protein
MKKIQFIYKTDLISFTRSLLALCFLITLIFTPLRDLFPDYNIDLLKSNRHGLNWLNLFFLFDNIVIPYFISIAILILSIIGIYPRYFMILQSWVSYSIYYSVLITEGGDQINAIITFLLIPICLFDNRKNGWKLIKNDFKFNEVNLYFVFLVFLLIRIQIAVLYLNAGISKIYAPEWDNGTAVYYWFNDPMFGASDIMKNIFGFLFENSYTITIINWGVIFLELFLFTGVFLKQKFKYLLFILGFIFHFLIFLIHGLATFWVSMSACLVLYSFNLRLSIRQNFLVITQLIYYEAKLLFTNNKIS